MRFCTGCGKQLNDGQRFCTGCGKDNGPDRSAAPVDYGSATGMTGKTGGAAPAGIDTQTLVHWAAIIFLGLASFFFLYSCLRSSAYVMVRSMISGGGIVLAIIYYIIGMWSVVPVISTAFGDKDTQGKKVIGLAVILLALIIVIAIAWAITKNMTNGVMVGVSAALATYKARMVLIIIFSALAGAAEIVRPMIRG